MSYIENRFKIKTLNNIDAEALSKLTTEFTLNHKDDDDDAIIVRSADMHSMEITPSLRYVGPAGSGLYHLAQPRADGFHAHRAGGAPPGF